MLQPEYVVACNARAFTMFTHVYCCSVSFVTPSAKHVVHPVRTGIGEMGDKRCRQANHELVHDDHVGHTDVL